MLYTDVNSLFATRKYQKKKKKMMKIVHIGKESLQIFLATLGILTKFPGKMCLMILLKVSERQGFALSLENSVLIKPQAWSN